MCWLIAVLLIVRKQKGWAGQRGKEERERGLEREREREREREPTSKCYHLDRVSRFDLMVDNL